MAAGASGRLTRLPVGACCVGCRLILLLFSSTSWLLLIVRACPWPLPFGTHVTRALRVRRSAWLACSYRQGLLLPGITSHCHPLQLVLVVRLACMPDRARCLVLSCLFAQRWPLRW
jgi:hypothetical protein